MKKVLLFFSLKYRGNWDRIYCALEQKESVLKSEVNSVNEIITSDYLTIIDSNFPPALKRCSNPPFVLYTAGNQELLINYDQTIGIVNGKKYDDYGLEVIKKLVIDWIKKGCVLVFGSTVALNDQLLIFIAKNKGSVVIITSEDLISFKAKNKTLIEKFEPNQLLVVSEFYQDQDPECDNQELYYRLIVALSRRLVFVEITKKDSNFEIFNVALREDKEIFSVPQQVGSVFDGCNTIIKRRGKLVENGDDVIPKPIYH